MVNLAVVGIGNFGEVHVNAARSLADAGLARFVAAADLRLDAYPETVAELRKCGVACYTDYREMLAAQPELSLVTLPLPIYLHAPLTIECLERGLHVLVEKPPAATLPEVEAMAAAARRTGRLCGVAFQFSTSNLYCAARQAIQAGKIGTITDVAVLCLDQRGDNYYARAAWAGKLHHNGRVVRDGSLNNPFAHFAQMALSLAGAARGSPAQPTAVEADLYAGHDIEGEDTCALRAKLNTGATLHFFSSLCSGGDGTIEMRVGGTEGMIIWGAEARDGEIRYGDGRADPLPPVAPHGGSTAAMLRNIINVVEGRAARLACPIEDTLAFARLVDMAYAGERVMHLHDTSFVQRDAPEPGQAEMYGGARTYLAGVEEIGREAFRSGRLPSEVGAPWAKA